MTLVLLVEDDAGYRTVLGRTLAAAGFRVAAAEGLTDATSAASAQPPDLALVDLRLADGDGVSVVRMLAERAPACRAVMLSGHGTIPDAVEAMRAGAVDFLTKPLGGDEIVAALKDALEPLPSAARSDAPPSEHLDQVERSHILGVLQATGGNISEAARRLGLHRRTLQRKLQKLPPAR